MADEAGDPAGPPFGIPESPRVVVDRRQRRFEGDAQVRLVLTYMFIAIFAGTIAISAFRLSGSDWANTKEWLQALLPAETALIGSATGFYFGSTRKGPDQ